MIPAFKLDLRLLWSLKPGWISSFVSFVYLASDVLSRLISGSITADLLVASMEAEPITHILFQATFDWAVVRIESSCSATLNCKVVVAKDGDPLTFHGIDSVSNITEFFISFM